MTTDYCKIKETLDVLFFYINFTSGIKSKIAKSNKIKL
jgi:hypothetical protein